MDKGIVAVAISAAVLGVAGALIFWLVMQGIDEGCIAGIEQFREICGNEFGGTGDGTETEIPTFVPRSGA